MCSVCGSNVTSYNQLKQHMRSEHSQCRATQKDNDSIFEEYPCYYCDRVIVSTNDLEMHGTTCYVGVIVNEVVKLRFPVTLVRQNVEISRI